jgi:hypothetical protein
MTELNRRAIIAVGGGVALLAACKPAEQTDTNHISGVGLYGEAPDRPGLDKFPKGGKVNFDPQYVCLVYLKVDGAKLLARHAYYSFSSMAGEAGGPESWAKRRFASAAKNAWLPDGLWPPAPPRINPRENFADFDFGSQQVIYFYIDNGNDVVFDPENLVSFTPYSTKDGRPTHLKPNKKTVSPNNAFFSARRLEPNLLYLENWFTDKNGNVIDTTANAPKYDEQYSLDIHLLMAAAIGTATIPIIIDPDTGNGNHRRP